MYSDEINDYLAKRNFNVAYDEIEDMRLSSPQLNRIKFEGVEGDYSRYKIATNDNHTWDVFVKNKEQ